MQLTNMITAVDLHACGEPGRVITGGVLDVPGKTMFEKMKYFEKNHDDIRLRMLREPRGYPALCCNLILPPTNPKADAGFIIMEQVEYPPMSGTNTICVATVLLETGMLPMHEPVTELTLESPAGLIRVRADCAGGAGYNRNLVCQRRARDRGRSLRAECSEAGKRNSTGVVVARPGVFSEDGPGAVPHVVRRTVERKLPEVDRRLPRRLPAAPRPRPRFPVGGEAQWRQGR